jgi:hypothetical protein
MACCQAESSYSGAYQFSAHRCVVALRWPHAVGCGRSVQRHPNGQQIFTGTQIRGDVVAQVGFPWRLFPWRQGHRLQHLRAIYPGCSRVLAGNK